MGFQEKIIRYLRENKGFLTAYIITVAVTSYVSSMIFGAELTLLNVAGVVVGTIISEILRKKTNWW